MDRLFYVIYNSYYKHGNYKNDIPTLTVAGIFTVMWLALALTIWTIFFNDIFSLPQGQKINVAKTQLGENSLVKYSSLVLSATLTYMLYYYNKRYKTIYTKYKDNGTLNTKKAKYLSFGIAVAVIVSPFITALIKNKIYIGSWI